jgi:hypothetical protein
MRPVHCGSTSCAAVVYCSPLLQCMQGRAGAVHVCAVVPFCTSCSLLGGIGWCDVDWCVLRYRLPAADGCAASISESHGPGASLQQFWRVLLSDAGWQLCHAPCRSFLIGFLNMVRGNT